jgi:hypothetical protein
MKISPDVAVTGTMKQNKKRLVLEDKKHNTAGVLLEIDQ